MRGQHEIWTGQDPLSATADLIGNNSLDEHKDPEIRTEIEILDNNSEETGYDIESIQVGDTCSLRGFNELTSQTFEDNMTISEVRYSLDKVIIVLWNKQVEVGRQISTINTKLDDTINGDSGE